MRHELFVTAGILTFFAAALAQGQAPVRRILNSGRPIEQQLRADDERVYIDLNPYAPLLVTPSPAVHMSDYMVDHTDVSFLGTVADKQSYLTTDHTSVRSVVTLRIERLFRLRRFRSLKPGDSVSLNEEGGILQVGKVMVEAGVSWAKPFQVSTRYLVFASVTPDGELLTGPASSYELASEFGLPRFRRMMPDSGKENDIQDLPPEEVFTRIENRLRAQGLNQRQ